MYNLIVTAELGAWDRTRYVLDQSRVGEHTDDVLKARYRVLDDRTIPELKSFPTLFAYEKANDAPARVGRVKGIATRGAKVRFEYEVFKGVPAIPAKELLALALDLDLDEWEMNRTHWAVKDVDLIEVLGRAGILRPAALRAYFAADSLRPPSTPSEQLIGPTVFTRPTVGPEADLVSVMMPLAPGFDGVYLAIKVACKEVGLRCLRADDIWEESILIQDIVNLIYRSTVVVVDFSERNPNVMYETGIAHTLGRTVVPISQSVQDLPFDLQHHRTLLYSPTTEGLETMKGKLERRLRGLTARKSVRGSR